tara:strand:+ start:384 stop:839 length:456 start_codon:yes stop_codon:yes gene_type:complete
MDYNFQIWLKHKYDKQLYRYHIIDNLYQMTLDGINNLGLQLKDEEYFFHRFIKFIYYHSKVYNGENSTEYSNLIISKIDETREEFDSLFEMEIINIANRLKEYLEYNAFDLFNSKCKNPNFVELIYNNVIFSLSEDLSDSETSEVEETYYE